MANLARLYTNDAKYSSKNNKFDYKLTIFIDFYNKANISYLGLSQAYSTMLQGLALNHYYTNLKNNSTSALFY